MKFAKILLIFFILNSCQENNVQEIQVYRFDQELFSVDSLNIDDKLSKWDDSFLDFLSFYYREVLESDNFSVDKIKEEILLGIKNEQLVYQINFVRSPIEKEFLDFNNIVQDIEKSANNFHVLFPDLEIPSAVVTVYSEYYGGIEMERLIDGIMFKGDTVVLPLERYLGYKFYNDNSENFPSSRFYQYLIKTWDKRYITRDILEKWCNSQFGRYNKRTTFLDHLIYKGKIMYLMFKCMPNHDPENIFKFSKDEYEGCELFESEIWESIKEKDLYSEDAQNYHDFFNYGPPIGSFNIDGKTVPTPSRLGYFIGYKIVDNYIKKNNVSLKELMQNTNSQEILLQSKYNPEEKHEESWIKKYWWTSFILVTLLGYFLYNRKT